MRRNRTALGVVTALALIAAGCGSDDDTATTTPEAPATTQEAATTDTTEATTEGTTEDTVSETTPATQPELELDLPASCDAEQGISDDTINITVISDLSGPISAVGGIIHAQSFEAYFDMINDEGGIDGRTVEVDVRDGKYDATTAVQEYEQVRLDTAGVPDILGSSMIEAVAADMEADCLITFQGANNGQLAQRYTSVFSPSPSAGHDVVSGIAWALEQTPDATFAVATQSDAFGEALKAGSDFAASESGFEYLAEVTFGPRDTELTAQVQALLAADPDYVIYNGLPTQLAALSAGVYAAGNDMTFLVPTGGWSAALLGTPAADALVANVVHFTPYANWDSDAPGVVHMRDTLTKYAPDLQPGSSIQTAYVAAMVTAEALKKASAEGDLTLGGIYRAAATLQFDSEGVVPPHHYGSSADEPRIPGHSTGVYRPDPSREGGVAPVTDGFVLFDLSERYVEPN